MFSWPRRVNSWPCSRSLRLLLAAFVSGALLSTVHAQDRFRAREYRVRVAVADKVDQLAIRGAIQYQVANSEGVDVYRLPPYLPYSVQITRGRPGQKIYRLVLREMDARQVDEAIALARQAKETHAMAVKVLRLPSREPGGGPILVTLGEFGSLEEARASIRELSSEDIETIFEDQAIATQGEIRLLDGDGVIRARDPKRLRLTPIYSGQGNLTLAEIAPHRSVARALDGARRYRGSIELWINEDGTLTAVNDLWIEFYLYSVVAAEIGPDAPEHALKAQAVAARSEAVAKYERRIVSSSFFDFHDTALAQAYPGRAVEAPRVREAVDATRGEILVWRGQAVDAVYSHSCGGVCPSSRDVWDGTNEGYAPRHFDRLLARSSPDLRTWKKAREFLTRSGESLCNPDQRGFPKYARKYYRWKRNFTGAEFSRLANKIYGTGTVKDVTIDRRTPSGRVRKMRIIGDKRTVTVDRELKLRRALGGIYSTFFVLDKARDANGRLKSLRIHGGGFGHGVGLCQMGATMMARQGYNYRQILAHYYTDVKIRRLYI